MRYNLGAAIPLLPAFFALTCKPHSYGANHHVTADDIFCISVLHTSNFASGFVLAFAAMMPMHTLFTAPQFCADLLRRKSAVRMRRAYCGLQQGARAFVHGICACNLLPGHPCPVFILHQLPNHSMSRGPNTACRSPARAYQFVETKQVGDGATLTLCHPRDPCQQSHRWTIF